MQPSFAYPAPKPPTAISEMANARSGLPPFQLNTPPTQNNAPFQMSSSQLPNRQLPPFSQSNSAAPPTQTGLEHDRSKQIPRYEEVQMHDHSNQIPPFQVTQSRTNNQMPPFGSIRQNNEAYDMGPGPTGYRPAFQSAPLQSQNNQLPHVGQLLNSQMSPFGAGSVPTNEMSRLQIDSGQNSQVPHFIPVKDEIDKVPSFQAGYGQNSQMPPFQLSPRQGQSNQPFHSGPSASNQSPHYNPGQNVQSSPGRVQNDRVPPFQTRPEEGRQWPPFQVGPGHSQNNQAFRIGLDAAQPTALMTTFSEGQMGQAPPFLPKPEQSDQLSCFPTSQTQNRYNNQPSFLSGPGQSQMPTFQANPIQIPPPQTNPGDRNQLMFPQMAPPKMNGFPASSEYTGRVDNYIPSVSDPKSSYPPFTSVNEASKATMAPPPLQAFSTMQPPSFELPQETISPRIPTFPPPLRMSGPPSDFSHGTPLQPTAPQMLPPSVRPGRLTQDQQKVSPDQLPDYIKTKYDLANKFSSVFETGTARLPPPSSLPIVYKDTGNCSPRYVRSTVYLIPSNHDMVKQSQIPIAFAVTPLAQPLPSEERPMLTSFEGTLPVRCNRCKCYMCPAMRFIDGGNKFQCPFCDTSTKVPPEYFAHIDYSGRRIDHLERPELFSSSYEISATLEYCKNGVLPKPAKFIFVIDVSYSSVKSGLLKLLCDNLRTEILSFLPRDTYDDPNSPSPVEIGIIAADTKLYFYNLKQLDRPEVLVVPDISDAFLPLLDGFFVSANDITEKMDQYLQELHKMFENTHETQTALGPAISAACNALKAAESPGKIFVFLTNLPTDSNIPGKLANREETNLLGTEKEKVILAPAIKYYTELGQQCVANGCAVDLFLFPHQYIDVSSISEVSRVSGGQVYYYRYFSAEVDGEKFLADLRYTVSRETVFDAVMRVRSSNGIRATDFIGSFYMQNATDTEFGALDCDKTIFVEFNHDDKIPEEATVYFQVALLYTSVGGRRRIRIHNLHLPCTNNYIQMYQYCDFESIVTYILKVAARSLAVSNIKQIRENVMKQLATILSCYRTHSPNSSSAALLVLPETLKVCPLFVNSLLKCDAIAGVQSVTPDVKSWLLNQVLSMGTEQAIAILYPTVVSLTDLKIDDNNGFQYQEIRCMYSALRSTNIYLLENSISLWVWIGQDVPGDVLKNLFGTPVLHDIKLSELYDMPVLNNPMSTTVRSFITDVMVKRKKLMRVNVVRQGHTLEPFFRNHLVEDSGLGGTKSYTDFLYDIHGQIRTMLDQ